MMLQCRAKEKDMAELFGKKYTNRTRFTRMCIGEAVFSLMDKKPYEEIRVSDIVKRAGVSRMTFYHYYEQKEDALADYFHEIVNGYVRERSEIIKKGGKFHDPGSIEHALKYFDQYAAFILKLVDAHLYHIILEAMNSFMMERIQPVYKIPPYELYFYGGALMNVFVMWEKNGKRETPEAIAKTLASGAVFTADTFPASCDGNR
ncbi:TetR/AcrR family transcriptional regulator [Firmicutes bacterium AF16-15]|nr:TetR/AcrR family transcriptional regulator [Firmicutes bacterium AF16-15]RHP04491.1 TetR/AcrR family transcriptional regulator [Firmicutes bacterium AF36-19BH]